MDVQWFLMILGSVLVNVALFLAALVIIFKHIKSKKFEFFFIFIMISIPLAFFINNFFQIYSYTYGNKNESVILDFEKHDRDRMRTFLRWRRFNKSIKYKKWFPLLLLWTVGSAYLFRTITYHHMIESWTIRIGQHMTMFKKVNIILFSSIKYIIAMLLFY